MSMQRVYGLFLVVAGGAVAAIVWGFPLGEPVIVRSLAAVCPFLAILGLAMIVLPSPYTEREARGEDMWELSGLRLLTRRWWTVVFAAMGLAAGAYFLPPEFLGPRAGQAIQAAHIDAAKK